jgi:hypothetical protein
MTDSSRTAMIVIIAAAIGGLFVRGGGGGRYDDRQESAHESAAASESDGCTTEDCLGFRAGYEWAENNGITSADVCAGSSKSFVEGCELYAAASADTTSLDVAIVEAADAAAESEQEYLRQ